MIVKKINDYTGGWFIGNFEPSIINTKDFEIAYKKHLKDEVWPTHFHKLSKSTCLATGQTSSLISY